MESRHSIQPGEDCVYVKFDNFFTITKLIPLGSSKKKIDTTCHCCWVLPLFKPFPIQILIYLNFEEGVPIHGERVITGARQLAFSPIF